MYRLLKFPAKLALLIWCRHLRINDKAILNASGPILLAANHPDSFLDAILLCTIFKRPVHSLARGDVFTRKTSNALLRSMNMLPVYRLREGAENLEENYKTFADCIEVFKQNGIVLIFSEGACVNEWNLRPLMKGTARLVLQAWEQKIPLTVLPLGINYNSFRRFGKNIILNFGVPITEKNAGFSGKENYGEQIRLFNAALRSDLEKRVIQIKPPDKKMIRSVFEVAVPALKKILLFIPAVFGFLLHAPLYIPVQKIVYKKFGKIDHYDSVMTGALFLLYPFYLILFAVITGIFFGAWWWVAVFFIMPFMAWSYVGLKRQV
ncbi:MAG: 1-acyl-sn-glycerol-3-phosphate acyltransferase [Ferruginibacter sp.]